VIKLVITLVGRCFVSISMSASDVGAVFQEGRLGPEVFEIGIVAVVLLDLGTLLSTETIFDLGKNLFICGLVQTWRSRFTLRFSIKT